MQFIIEFIQKLLSREFLVTVLAQVWGVILLVKPDIAPETIEATDKILLMVIPAAAFIIARAYQKARTGNKL